MNIKYYSFCNPLKMKGAHYCYICNTKLETISHSKIVNPKDADSNRYDFSMGFEGVMIGDCKFIHKVFYCPICKTEIEPVTQLSFEDLDSDIEFVKKHFAARGVNLIIKKYMRIKVVGWIVSLQILKISKIYGCQFLRKTPKMCFIKFLCKRRRYGSVLNLSR